MSATLVSLGEVADVNWGDTSVTKSSYVPQGYTAYSATGADGFLPYADYDRRAIVLSAIGARCGKTWFVEGKWSCIKNTIRFWSVDERLDDRYLYWVTNKEDFFPKRGAAQPFITIGDARDAKIPLPPLGEQRQIAAILDKADALRCKRKRTIELLGSLTQSTFREMFIDKGWPKHTVETLARDIRTGPFGSQLLHSEFVDEGIAVLGIDNVVANEFRWAERRYITPEKYTKLRRYKVLPRDVLITIMGTCGRCAVVPDDVPVAINTKHLCCITLDANKCLPEFLQVAFLQDPDVLQQLGVQAKGAVMPGLNMGIIKALSIPTPPIELQTEFAEKVSAVKMTLDSLRRSEIERGYLFSSLQHRAFSGQL